MDVYGAETPSLEGVRERLERSLGYVCEARESTYRGGDYYRCASVDGDRLIIQRNVDPTLAASDSPFAEPGFPQFKVIVYVERARHPDELGRQLRDAGLTGLR